MIYLVIFLGTWGWMWRVVWVTQCRWQLTSVSSSVPLESRSYWMRTAHMKKGGSHVNAGWVDMVLGKVSRKNDIVHWGFLPLFCNKKWMKNFIFFSTFSYFFWVNIKYFCCSMRSMTPTDGAKWLSEMFSQNTWESGSKILSSCVKFSCHDQVSLLVL